MHGDPLASVVLEPHGHRPLQEQLYQQIRDLIISGHLRDTKRLPSTRTLAQDLCVSRTTTLAAYDQLAAEGLIDQRRGAGAYVIGRTGPATPSEAGHDRRQQTTETADTFAIPPQKPLPFTSGIPEMRVFPSETWARATARALRRRSAASGMVTSAGGDQQLRHAIAEHLRTARGLTIEWRNVVITSGMRETLWLIARTFLQPGDTVIMENPGFPTAFQALHDAGLKVTTGEVDGQGICLDAHHERSTMRAALITPSRHYPLGVTLSAERRAKLLEWADRANRLIIEDDYDSEYRYRGRPLSPLFAQKAALPVVHIGSFSKVLFAGLRLAYIVADQDSANRLVATQSQIGSQASVVPQIGLAEFMESGAFAAHIRRTRRLYRTRQEILVSAIATHMDGFLTCAPQDAGIHLIADIAPGLLEFFRDVDLAKLAELAGVFVRPLSSLCFGPQQRQGLILGFAAFDEQEIEAALKNLASAFRQATMR